MNFTLNSQNSLPDDATQGCLIGRAWIQVKFRVHPYYFKGNQVLISRKNFILFPSYLKVLIL